MNINNHKSYTNTHKHKSTELSRYQVSAVHLIHTKSSSAHHEHLCNKGEYHWQEHKGGTQRRIDIHCPKRQTHYQLMYTIDSRYLCMCLNNNNSLLSGDNCYKTNFFLKGLTNNNKGLRWFLYLCSQAFDSLLPTSLHLRGPRAAVGPQSVGGAGRWSGLWWLAERKFCAWSPTAWMTQTHTLSHMYVDAK